MAGDLTLVGDLFPGGDLERQLDEMKANVAKLLAAVGQRGACRGCGREIWWLVHSNGKRAPYTRAGLNHFIDCPRAKEFKRK